MDTSSSSSFQSETIVLKRWQELLLEDSTMILMLSLLVSIYPTYTEWDLILLNQIPFPVAICWLCVAYAAGKGFPFNFWRTTNKGGLEALVNSQEVDERLVDLEMTVECLL